MLLAACSEKRGNGSLSIDMNSKADAGNVSVSTPMLRRSGENADRHCEERQFQHRRGEALSEIGGNAFQPERRRQDDRWQFCTTQS
jgi:hypothetical protein